MPKFFQHEDNHSSSSSKLGSILFILLIVGFIVMALIAGPNTDSNELNGVWMLKSKQTNGSPKRREKELWVILNGKLQIITEYSTQTIRFRQNPKSSPKQLDMDLIFKSKGIYEIQGNLLRVCQTVVNQPRPMNFHTEVGDLKSVSLFTKLDTDPSTPIPVLESILSKKYGPPKEYLEPIQFNQKAEKFVSNIMREIYNKHDEDLTEKERVVYFVSWLETEVDNGGFHQFFHNSSGGNAIETIESLKKIGANETASLVEKGCRVFPDRNPPKDYILRRKQLKDFTLDQSEILRDLENQFYSRREDLNLLLKNYWDQ